MNRYFHIIPDSTCDLNEELRKEYDILYTPGHVLLPSGEEVPAKMSWDAYGEFSNGSAETFYDNLMKDPDKFKTSPCNTEEVYELFVRYAREGEGVLMTTISSMMSGTYSFACEARERVLEEYPDAQIRVVDTRRFSVCNGLMCLYASLLRGQGKSLDEVADLLEDKRLCFHQMGWHDNLAFAAKKGRITHSKAFMGRLIGIKTLGECSSTGMTTVVAKVRGTAKAYRATLEYIARTIEKPEAQIIIIGHTARLENAQMFKTMIEERFHPRAVYIGDVFPSCGVNIGPGLVAAYYFGTPISEDLVEEKALIEGITAKL